ncbi:peptidoglycan recognition family protein [Anabaena cylindrica UHCC 0172]|uniref:peptidoglycan recognition protein family protein n=1 Tax=Anabaena cylindrica TaxID=1165 RepID=UPI002B217EAC|nr:peptidoglycan recognition family protein [Anabaena cylindrica]MEA5552823.1 peptidoglycan recognition family protein [Anabaena cylindrica UHCC 0172]
MKQQNQWLFEVPPIREMPEITAPNLEINRDFGGIINTISSIARGASNLFSTRIEDRTAFSPKDKRKNLRRGNVYALVLHQMAFSRGDDIKKYDRVTAHFIITPNGAIAQLHPISAYLYTSNGFNKHSVAVEFAGNFPSIRGKCWQPKPPAKSHGCHTLTSAQITAGRFLIQYLISKTGLTHVLAHCQSSATRANDPGPDIWYHVGQWAVENLGMKDGGAGFKVGNGSPIPDSWRTWGRR